ncbi:MAG: response regulator transcription factor [Verrucomicrobiota bacterium]
MKILIIEDDHDLRDSLIQTLEDESFVVDSAIDGELGLYRAQEWNYDVIILDVMLPKLDGWAVLQQLRSSKNATPVLMLTAQNAVDDRVTGLNLGADDYLAKPFHEKELVARLHALARRSSGVAENRIILGDFAIDTAAQQVFKNGEPIKLSVAQFRLIAHLATRRGQIVSRMELAEAITNEEDTAPSNVIDVQVHHIRRRLGKDLVQSRRGVGYYIPLEEAKA